MIGRFKNWLRSAIYQTGILGCIHRLRNRDTLTVFMFHRVLPKGSVCLEKSEREFAFTEDGFCRTLDFILRHYSPVTLDQVKQAMGGQVRLPRRAALITFDDGWRDTLLHALPALKSRKMPAVLFLSTEAVALVDDRWWQDHLVEAMLNPEITRRIAEELGVPADSNSRTELGWILTAKIAEMSSPERIALLRKHVSETPLPRQMLQAADLADLMPWITISGHGHTHGPLSYLSDPECDLQTCRIALEELDVDALTMSFPHGQYNQKIVNMARRAGFKYLFSSDPYLVSHRSLRDERDLVIGRIHIPENVWTCDDGIISFPRLSTFLFFRKTQ